MNSLVRFGFAFGLGVVASVGNSQETSGQTAWTQFGGSATHVGQALAPAQHLNRIKWQTPVDLIPHHSGGGGGPILIHYGTTLITKRGTLIIPVKRNEFNDFFVEARLPERGRRIWTQRTDFTAPTLSWIPAFGPALLPNGTLVMPAAGGTVLLRTNPDSQTGHVKRIAFFGDENYKANPAAYNSTVQICTPITTDDDGNIFFGFRTEAGAPNGLVGGIAKIAPDGSGSWVSAAAAALDPAMIKPVYNCAPAVSPDGKVYIAVNSTDWSEGYVVSLDKATMAPIARISPHDPRNGNRVAMLDYGTSSPMIAPDGHVYMGVFENPYNGSRGWLSHLDANLTTEYVSGAFGWDNTPSLIPASLVPQYTGTSNYLLFCKYNYYGAGGNADALAIVDPFDSQIDPLTNAPIMKEILRVSSPLGREWCINTAAVDLKGQCVTGGNEDGFVYKWSWVSNTLSESKQVTAGIGEAYTPTFIGPDGTVYVINHATLFAVGE